MPARWKKLLVALGGMCLSILIAAHTTGCAAQEAESPAPAQAEELPSIPELLQTIAAEADPEANVALNDGRVEWMTRMRAAETDGKSQFEWDIRLSRELLLAGETERAIDRFRQIEDVLKTRGATPEFPLYRTVRELLALSYMRLGEQDNCVAHHGIDSCLMPIQGSGVHREQRGSRAAIAQYTGLLKDHPDDLGYRWLLNLAYMTVGEYPQQVPAGWRIPPDVFDSEAAQPRFFDVAARLGVDVPELSGGVALEDFDGDGFLDIVASSWGLTDQLRFFHNDGDGSFTERTEAAGLTGEWGGLNLNHADYDNDGDADILVLRGGWLFAAGAHPNSLLRNRGDGTFENVTREAGLLAFQPTQTAGWADFDGDGWLDLFVGSESSPAARHASHLYRNDGDGTFTEVAAKVGLTVEAFVKGVAWGDYDNDGRPDLYLSRFGQPNQLFHNDGPGGAVAPGSAFSWHFSDVTAVAGVAEPRLSFPTWFFDFDNDGWLDILVAPYSGFLTNSLPGIVADYLGGETQLDRLHLYRNAGDGTFAEVAAERNIAVPLLAMGSNYGDLDNDGFPDCYFGTGEPNMSTLVPNRMFLNGKGARFFDVTTNGGFGHLQKGHGIAFGDVDNDGDQDIYAVMGGAYSGDGYPNVLFENPGNEHRWITLLLRGVDANRAAIGARIEITVREGEATRRIHSLVGTGGSFGSSSLQQESGLGNADRIESVLVRWPGGTEQRFTGLPLDRFVELTEGQDAWRVVERKKFRLTSP